MLLRRLTGGPLAALPSASRSSLGRPFESNEIVRLLRQNQAKNSNDKDVCYFADLPGYGYAKMSKDKQRTIEVSYCM